MPANLNITFSHVGLFVADIELMAAFYKRVFDLVETDAGEVRGGQAVFLTRDPAEHHEIVLEEAGDGPVTRVQQLSFRVGSLGDLRAMMERVERDGEAERVHTVNHGNAWSVYCYDPEGNRIETFVDTPFHLNQPRVSSLDLSQSDEEILQTTIDAFNDDPNFLPRADWESDMRKKFYI